MEPALLDTDILSELLKGKNASVAFHARAYLDRHVELRFTSVTAMELLFGLLRKSALIQVEQAKAFFAEHREVRPSERDYIVAAEIMAALDRRGTPIGPYDPLIAACALNRGLTLITGNTRHFTFVQEAGFPLRIEDWRQP